MKSKVLIKKLNSSVNIPEYKTAGSSGLDLEAFIHENLILKPNQTVIVPTGLSIAIDNNLEIQIRPRSGLAVKSNISVLNTPGTIDADYRGEIGVILINLSAEEFIIEDGERVAQMVIAKHEQADWQQVVELIETQRGAGGFGSTGVK